MLKNSEKYYLYRHIRLDTGNVFYVGIGTGRRAWKKENRNKHWHNIVNIAKANHISKLHKPGGWNKGASLPIEQRQKMSESAKVRAERKRTKGGQYA